MPFLIHAKRVVIASVAETGESLAQALSDVARQLAWNGVRAELRPLVAAGAAIPGVLAAAAQDCNADLMVLGAYGHSRMREILFGSCTRSVIHDAGMPVLLMH
jgi:nucleotide-binding universal stress UspA family protein